MYCLVGAHAHALSYSLIDITIIVQLGVEIHFQRIYIFFSSMNRLLLLRAVHLLRLHPVQIDRIKAC